MVIVVDEAHRFRNRRSQKRVTLEAAPRAPIVLATATPVVNSADDLRSLLELFIDDADARALTGYDLATSFAGEVDVTELLREVVVRRLDPPREGGFGGRPRAHLRVVEYEPPTAEAWVWHNLEACLGELELAAIGPDWPRGLFVEHVLRRWESGPAALGESLDDLAVYHERWLEAADHGSRLDRSGFRSLFGDNAAQMVFQFLYDEPNRPPCADEVERVRADLVRLNALRARAAAVLRDGTGRDQVVLELAREPQKLLVFTSFRRAAHGLFERLQDALGPRARVGLVTGSEVRATGLGRTSAEEVLRRFAPQAAGVGPLRDHESLRILIATDCLAEGVNLQDCGRVVLADLPYTPVAVEQRVGRLLRPGGPHREVEVYLPRPTNWNDSLGMRRRLHAKLVHADDAGVAGENVLEERRSGSVGAAAPANPYAALAALDGLAARLEAPSEPLAAFAATQGPDRGRVIALCRIHDGARPRPWLFGLSEDGTPQSLPDLLPEVVELVYDRREVVACDVEARVTAVIEERRAFLEAARLGPPPLELDAPEVRAWRRLCDGLDDPAFLDDLRPRLLYRQRASVRAALDRLARANNSLSRLVRYVRSLPVRACEPVRIEIVACLQHGSGGS